MRFGRRGHSEGPEPYEPARHGHAELLRSPTSDVPAAEPRRDAPRLREDLLSVAGDRAERELFVRHARKDGRLVAVLRAVDRGAACIVEAEVYPHGSTQLTRPGPYTFADAHQASAFVTEAVAALMYLGCDIQAH